MDNKQLNIVNSGSTTNAAGNSTDVTVPEVQEVETLTIIVWCVGGILLISLLTLLGRIILAEKKTPVDQYDYLENMPVTRSNSLLRIHIDGRNFTTRTPSRDTVELVLGSHAAVTDSPVLSRNTNEQINQNNQGNPTAGNQTPNQRTSNQIETRQLNCGRYMTIPPPRTAQLLQTDENGSRAAINGYIIRPPPYREVVNSYNPVPSVVVTRDQTQPRRQIFSL
ncbi:hypothetical protein ACF0H5_014444 [Mactra antiquata]